MQLNFQVYARLQDQQSKIVLSLKKLAIKKKSEVIINSLVNIFADLWSLISSYTRKCSCEGMTMVPTCNNTIDLFAYTIKKN